MPDRYLVANPPPDPESYAFGFGRRYLHIPLFIFALKLNLAHLEYALVFMWHSSQCGCPSGNMRCLPVFTLLTHWDHSNTLANFNITKTKDGNGLEITPDERYTNDIIRLVWRYF
jgi:hypothetical protein